jgi:hypothetical protein
MMMMMTIISRPKNETHAAMTGVTKADDDDDVLLKGLMGSKSTVVIVGMAVVADKSVLTCLKEFCQKRNYYIFHMQHYHATETISQNKIP